MPKSSLDWLGVVSIWIAGIILAFRSADAPLVSGAPTLFAANFWNFIPAILASIAMSIFIYRLFVPAGEKRTMKSMARSAPVPELNMVHGTAVSESDGLEALRKARDNATIQIHQGTMRTLQRACHELEAAMVTLNKRYQIALLPFSTRDDEVGLKMWLESYIRYIDSFLPMLRAGHIDEAREKANEFQALMPGSTQRAS